jgi:Cell division GTPase
MKVTAIGVGGAGCRVVDAMWRDDQSRESSYLAAAQVLDTDTESLDRLESVPKTMRVPFGSIETEGTGTDGDRAAGTAAITGDMTALRRRIDDAITSAVEAVVVVASLGGGTGSGATPHLIRRLVDGYDLPVYAVSILPAESEDSATETNATDGLHSLRDVATGQLLFDNGAWKPSGQSVAESRDRLNATFVEQLGALFAAGEPTSPDAVPESVVDASEIINTLAGGQFSTIGYRSQQVREPESGLKSWVESLLSDGDGREEVDSVESIKAVDTTVRRAVLGKLTLECDLESVSRGLLIIAGPPNWLNRQAIADSRGWLSRETDVIQLRGGDVPQPDATHISVTVLLSGVDSARISELTADGPDQSP